MKRYADLGDVITEALARYADEVRSGTFPEEQHTYAMPEDELKAFEATESTRATMSTGTTAAIATVAAARAHVQPCTERTPTSSSQPHHARHAKNSAPKIASVRP